MARRLLLNSRMGILADGTEVIPALTPQQFHGPGTAHTGYSEYNQRELLTRWADHLDRPATPAKTLRSAPRRRLGRRRHDVDPFQAVPRSAHTRSRFERTGASLAFDDPRHLQAYRWLVDEAWLLDTQDYTGWLETLTEDIHYLMPVRVSTPWARDSTTSPGMAHFDEDKYSLSRRVARFLTEHAWTEDPPRDCVTICPMCARCHRRRRPPRRRLGDSAVPQRGDIHPGSLVSAGREDLLRPDRRRVETGSPHDPGRRRGDTNAEPGDLPVTRVLPGLMRTPWPPQRTPTSERTLLAHATGEPLHVATSSRRSSCAAFRLATAPGCWSSRELRAVGESVPLELEALTWQGTATFSAMIGNPFGPLVSETAARNDRWLHGPARARRRRRSGMRTRCARRIPRRGLPSGLLERDPAKSESIVHELGDVR